jgi:hypothetical protein
MLSLLAVVKKKSQAVPDDDEDNEEGDDEDENNEEDGEESEVSSEDSASEPEPKEDLADMVTVSGESHQLRVLKLVELYLGNMHLLVLLCTVVPALLQALEAVVRRGGNAELVSRLVSVLGKVPAVPGKLGK